MKASRTTQTNKKSWVQFNGICRPRWKYSMEDYSSGPTIVDAAFCLHHFTKRSRLQQEVPAGPWQCLALFGTVDDAVMEFPLDIEWVALTPLFHRRAGLCSKHFFETWQPIFHGFSSVVVDWEHRTTKWLVLQRGEGTELFDSLLGMWWCHELQRRLISALPLAMVFIPFPYHNILRIMVCWSCRVHRNIFFMLSFFWWIESKIDCFIKLFVQKIAIQFRCRSSVAILKEAWWGGWRY